jgi:hypothetical protein
VSTYFDPASCFISPSFMYPIIHSHFPAVVIAGRALTID